jgi:hypothetical protein
MPVPPGLPIPYDLAAYIADQSIDLYRECLDHTGGDETKAQAMAAQTVAEGASLSPAELDTMTAATAAPPEQAAPPRKCARSECRHTLTGHRDAGGPCYLMTCECPEFVPEPDSNGSRA